MDIRLKAGYEAEILPSGRIAISDKPKSPPDFFE